MTWSTRHTAFTLLELLFAMMIVGICLGLAVPRFAGMRDAASVRGAAAEIVAAFHNARQSVITSGSMVAVVFDTTAGAVELRSNGRRISRHSVGAMYGVRLVCNRDSAVYDARGLGYGVSNLSLTVLRGTRTTTLTVSRLGRVRW